MKHLNTILILAFLLTSVGNLRADIATEGEHDVYIELINGDDFPGYKFFVMSQSYYYDMGYQEGPVTTVYLEKGKHISSGDRGSSSRLYAKGKKGTFKSSVDIGGAEINSTQGLNYILDRIKIVKISKKVVEFEVVERQLIGENGEVLQTIEKGSVAPLGTNSFLMWLLPIVSLVGLVVFFLFRRKGTSAA